MKYIAPTVFGSPYTCPHCSAIAKQDWWSRAWDQKNYGNFEGDFHIGKCQQCAASTIWVRESMYYPIASIAPPPNDEMPENVKRLYVEASNIAAHSPRGAAALLRLSIQVLCKELGEPGENIYTDIGSLVKKGLPSRVQQSLDIVRITGNNAVHPGEINVEEPDVTENLFKLVNLIVEYTISMPNHIDGVFNTLPEGSRDAINKRDKPKTP